MSFYDEVDTTTRDDLYAGAEQLERMTEKQLQLFVDDVESLKPSYDPTTDVLVIQFGVESQYGVTGWEFTHERLDTESSIGSEPDPRDAEQIETINRGTWNAFGTTTLSLYTPNGTPLEPYRILQGIYDTLIYLIGSDQQTLSVVTISPTQTISIKNAPDTGIDIREQSRAPWDEPVVVTIEMRQPDPEHHIERVPDAELPEVLEAVDAGIPMTRFQCDRQLEDCEQIPVKSRDDIRSLSMAQDGAYRDHQVFAEGERGRGVAVIANAPSLDKEEWKIPKAFHPQCGPTSEAFRSGEDELRLPGSKGKDEVYIEGTVSYGPPPDRDAEFSHRPVCFNNITVLGRRGDYSN